MSEKAVAVVGAGAVGLFTAYELTKRGVDVTVYERQPIDGLRNASWGNAGHIVPVMSVPLTSVANIASVFKSVFQRNSFMVLPRTVSMRSVEFLGKFAMNSRQGKWLRSVGSLVHIDRLALSEFERVQDEGLALSFERAPFVSAFRTQHAAHAQISDLLQVTSRGLELDIALLDEAELVRREPLARARGRFGVVLENQGLVQPSVLMETLRAELSGKGVKFVSASVESVESVGGEAPSFGVRVLTTSGTQSRFDQAVICSGAWLDDLAKVHGVGPRVLAGFGYSLRVDVPDLPQGMLYFPEAKIATTRMGDSLRISTLMQIDDPNGAFSPRGARRLEENARRVLPMAHWNSVREVWHGGRPISSDGMPIIGQTRTRNIYVNGGHGMWGVTLGPVSGRLLAEAMVEGRPDIDLAGFSATR